MTELIFTVLFQDPEGVLCSVSSRVPGCGGGLRPHRCDINISLRSPRSFFLCNLSPVIIPNFFPDFIADFLAKIKTTSLEGCMAQIFFSHIGVTEIFLLVVMAYDHYMATCKPLHYTPNTNRPVRHLLVNSSWWGGGFFHSVAQIVVTSQLSFCGPSVTDRYSCDLHPLFKLAYTETSVEGLLCWPTVG